MIPFKNRSDDCLLSVPDCKLVFPAVIVFKHLHGIPVAEMDIAGTDGNADRGIRFPDTVMRRRRDGYG
jgi:hypothetical protein